VAKEDEDRVGWIGPIGPIRIVDESTPRMVAAGAGMVEAQKLVSIDEHLTALKEHRDLWVRREVVPRLAARGLDDPRTVPALIESLRHDEAAEVRDAAATALWSVDDPRVRGAFSDALADPDEDVRWSAAFGLSQQAG
jgi:HEAT repeat protein